MPLSKLAGLKLLDPQPIKDDRGFFVETYRASTFAQRHGIDATFVQDNHSNSEKPGTIRGLHFQKFLCAQAKLVRVARGAVLDVVVDLRPGSKTYGHHAVVELRANGQQLYVPIGFAHGICTLEPNTDVIYKVTAEYCPRHDGGLRWNDPALGIAWPVTEREASLSDRDKKHPLLSELGDCFGAPTEACPAHP